MAQPARASLEEAKTFSRSRRTTGEPSPAGSLPLSRVGSTAGDTLVATLDYHVLKALVDLDNFGVQTTSGEQVLGGVLMTPMYLQHALSMEGKTDCGVDISQAKLVVAKLEGPAPTYIPITEAQLASESSLVNLPRGISLFATALSAAAISQLGWQRVPAVALLGRLELPADAVAAGEALGLVVSPSMAGPYQEEVATQLTVFLKNNKYPANKVYIMRDWGFVVFGSSVEEVVGCFDSTVRRFLAGVNLEGQTNTPTRLGALTAAFKRLGSFIGGRSFSEEGGVPAGAGGASASSPATPLAAPGSGASLLNPGVPLDRIVASEPTSPSAVSGAAAAMAAGLRSQTGSLPSTISLPDDIRKPPVSNGSRRTSQEGRIPSFVTGMRPW